MNRKYFRLISVVAVVLAINVTTFPVAEARALSGSHTAVSRTTDLWSATVTWLTGLLPNGNTGLRPAANATTLGGGTSTGTARPNTGSCIDPLGSTHCAS